MILVVFIAPGSGEEIGAKTLIVVVGNDSLFPLNTVRVGSRRFDERVGKNFRILGIFVTSATAESVDNSVSSISPVFLGVISELISSSPNRGIARAISCFLSEAFSVLYHILIF